MKHAPVLHAVEYGLFQLLRGLVRLLPHSAARHLGRGLGRFAYIALPRRRRTALDNLLQALPKLSTLRRREVARSAFAGMASHATEMLSWNRFDSPALCRRVTLEGWEHLSAGEKEGTAGTGACFVMTAHFGPWEVLAPVLSLYLPPAYALVRPLDNPRLEKILTEHRTRFGMKLITKHGAARRLVRGLESGGRIVVLVDQRVRAREAIEVPFFGRPARAPNLIARLAIRHRVPIVPTFVFPEPGGRYRIVARPAIAPPSAEETGDDAVAELTARCTAAVEREVRERPDLWLWMHDRWKLS